VAIGDHRTAREELAQPLVPPHLRATVVHEPDPEALDLSRRAHGQRASQRPVVHVPLHRGDRPEAAELGEHRRRGEIARMNDSVRTFEEPDALLRERPRAPRKMRVSE